MITYIENRSLEYTMWLLNSHTDQPIPLFNAWYLYACMISKNYQQEIIILCATKEHTSIKLH